MRYFVTFIVALSVFVFTQPLLSQTPQTPYTEGHFIYFQVNGHVPTGRNARADMSESVRGGFQAEVAGAFFLGIEGKWANLRPGSTNLFEVGLPILVSLGGMYSNEAAAIGFIPFVAIEETRDARGGVGALVQYRRGIAGRVELFLSGAAKAVFVDTDTFTNLDIGAGFAIKLGE